MKKIVKFSIYMVLLLWVCSNFGFGQEIHGKPDIWFTLLNKVRISKRIEIGNEFHLRRDNWLNDQEQLLLRPYLNYKTHENLKFTVGYTYAKTSPYGDYPLPIDRVENNVWEQFSIAQHIGKFKLNHRYRIEHRFIDNIILDNGNYTLGGHLFSNRFRYRLMLTFNLNERWSLNVYDELWFNLYENLMLRSFDRNWFALMIRRRVTRTTNIQFGYLHQWIRHKENKFERHPTFQIIIQHNFSKFK